MKFSEALERLTEGERIARSGWNGQGMHVVVVRECVATISGTHVSYPPHLAMKTAQGNYVPWLASQSDLMAEDWFVAG